MPHECRDERKPQILFIDAYDSFSNNIIALVKEKLCADVCVIHIDEPSFQNDHARFRKYLRNFDAVIAGPGPGSPEMPADIGLMQQLWALPDDDLLPVLGICLGFQSLALAFGGRVERLREPRHGIVASIRHNNKSIFTGIGDIEAILYNSLHVNIVQSSRGGTTPGNYSLWSVSECCPELQPLAWVLDDAVNGPMLVGVEHVIKPFWGVQYHPESICTNHNGASIIGNWWAYAREWNLRKGRIIQITTASLKSSGVQRGRRATPEARNAFQSNVRTSHHLSCPTTNNSLKMTSVNWKTLPLGGLSVARVCTLMGLEKGEIALLESATRKDGIPVNSETGKFSIIGCIDANETERLEYHVSSRRLLHHSGSFGTISEDQVDDVWAYLKSFMSSRQVHHGPPKSPFWGGLVGFVSYEACLDSLDVKPCSAHDNPPDACFLFIERSIVVDHVNQELHIQSLHSADAEWIDLTASLLSGPNVSPSPQLCNAAISSISQTEARAALSSVDWMPQSSISPTQVKPSEVQLISKERYCAKIRQCQEEIRAGNSYELCLTGQSTITMPRNAHRSDWDLYQQLRQHNPAPFGAYVRVQCAEGKVSILSSSPERFLNWDRNGHCQFRPVKGTVKKTSDMTYSKAQAILKSSKEQAENLMIVDLIRHDLHGVVGAGNVEVTKLMGTEEYETVYQLVSVIEGEITKSNRDGGTTGIDVLAASLPPGSMTGAPKKRSCEILRHIEDNKTRGIYSGVLGYLDVGSGGDFSVVIRTAYKWDRATTVEVADEKRAGETREFDIWTIGAGGAVTSQSTEIGEWDEMCTKRNALLHIFCPPDAAVLQGA